MPSPFVTLLLDYATETTLALVRTAVDTINAKLPAALGRDDAANSLSVALSTEDAAKVPPLGQAPAASSSPVVLPLTQASGPLALDATLTGGTARTGALGADGSTLASAANPLPVGPGTSTTWDVSSRAARLIGALTGVNGSGVATLANPVPTQLSDGSAGYTGAKTGQLPSGLGILTSAASLSVTSASDALFDVKDRAARLIGAVTGVNGSSVATGANPVPMQLSSGTTLYTGATAALSLPIVFARSLSAVSATLAINGDVIKASAGSALWITMTNTTGSSVYWQIHDLAAGPPANGARAAASAPAITANNGSRSGDLIGPTLGLGCNTGILLVLSLSPTTYSAVGSNSCSYSMQYL